MSLKRLLWWVRIAPDLHGVHQVGQPINRCCPGPSCRASAPGAESQLHHCSMPPWSEPALYMAVSFSSPWLCWGMPDIGGCIPRMGSMWGYENLMRVGRVRPYCAGAQCRGAHPKPVAPEGQVRAETWRRAADVSSGPSVCFHGPPVGFGNLAGEPKDPISGWSSRGSRRNTYVGYEACSLLTEEMDIIPKQGCHQKWHPIAELPFYSPVTSYNGNM